METQARYLLVGVFTVLCLLAGLGFTLWLAKVQLNRTFTQYDIVFDTVAGLGQASAVQYNGVDVGKVLTIELDRADPAKVRVRIEIYASTPIRTDTMATLASQGVTGVSFVALEGGSATSAPLRPVPPANVAVIMSKPSVMQGLITDAPDLLAEAILLMNDIRAFTTAENGQAITEILKNVEIATARIDDMATKVDNMMAAAQATLARADTALTTAEAAFETADETLTEAKVAVASIKTVVADDLPAIVQSLQSASEDVGKAAAALETFTREGLPQFTSLGSEARGLIGEIAALTRRIGSDPGRFILGDQTPDYRN
jgi:phospholipid/cholesterol/gamma-HCH transport system substrate-binding protein